MTTTTTTAATAKAMTEHSRKLPVVTIAGALFCLVLIYLALQLRAGNDPAIGAMKPPSAASPQRQVIVRRIIVRRIIEEEAPAPAHSGDPVAVAAAPAEAQPRVTQPGLAAAPPPAAAAPAPAAAPVVSRGS